MNGGAPSAALPRVFEPVLDRLRGEAQSLFGAAEVRLAPVRHEERPFSFLLRVAVHAGTPPQPGHLFLKVFKPKDPAAGVDLRRRVSNEFEAARAAYEFMSRWDDVGAVRPVACYPDLLAIVTEEVSGPTLLGWLESSATWFPGTARVQELEAAMTATGRWLKRFQEFEPTSGTVSMLSLREYVDVRLRRMVEHRVMGGQYRERLLAHLDRVGAQLTAADLREVPIHADFALGNILVSGSRIVVLDFAMANRGARLHDISRLFLQLDALRAKPWFRPRVIERLQTALLHGLDPALSTHHPLFRYLLMLHRINHLGTLALRRERFPAGVLNARVRRLHRQWIAAELASTESTS